jgi:hypothetical protein
MILSGHQPVYLPGVIFFNKLALSDIFMFVGHVQFSSKSWQQRNRIVVAGKELMLTVPVSKSGGFGKSIDDMKVIDGVWKKKHLGSIVQAYRKSKYFDKYYPDMERELLKEYSSLGELNRAIIYMMMGWMGIDTPVISRCQTAYKSMR